MDVPSTLLSPPLCLVAALLFLAALLQAWHRADWSRLKARDMQHVYFGAMALLTLFWFMRAGIRPGLNLHLLGAGLLTLMFGRAQALIALAVVTTGMHLAHGGDWVSLGVNGLLLAVIPTALAELLLRLAQALLPPNFFVYVFVNGYIGSGLSLCLAALSGSLLLGLLGSYSWHYLFTEYLPFAALLSFGEGFLSGGLAALMAVYRPRWIASFDDRFYLAKEPSGRFDG